MPDIKKYAPASGRMLKENNTIVNLADIAEEIRDMLSINSNYPFGAIPWTVTIDSEANTTKTLTKDAPGVGKSLYITAIEAVLSVAVAGTDINIVLKEDAGGAPIPLWKEIIGNAAVRGTRVGISFTSPIKISENKTADLISDPVGTAGGIITLNLAGYTL
jgi:hypothetical protein